MIGVINNPRARRNQRDPALADRLAAILGDAGEVVSPADPAALRGDLERLRADGLRALAINGGDGSLHVALTELLRVYGGAPLPALSLLRGGTMNTLAAGLGIRGTPETILRALVTWDESEATPRQIATRSCLQIGELSGFLFGNGLVSRFLELYYEGGGASPAKAARLLLESSLSSLVGGPLAARLMQTTRCRVSVDGVAWPQTDWLTIGAGTVDDIGLGFRPFFRCLDAPGQMHVLGLACSPAGVVAQLPAIRMARAPAHPDAPGALCRELVIEGDGPLDFMIDGDFHRGGERLVVRVGPTLRFFVPD